MNNSTDPIIERLDKIIALLEEQSFERATAIVQTAFAECLTIIRSTYPTPPEKEGNHRPLHEHDDPKT